MSGEHLPELLHFGPRCLVILDMPDQQGFVGLPIEPLLTGTHPLGTQRGIQAMRQQTDALVDRDTNCGDFLRKSRNFASAAFMSNFPQPSAYTVVEFTMQQRN